MVKQLNEEIFESILEIVQDNLSKKFEEDIDVESDNPYLILKTDTVLPGSRAEVISKLESGIGAIGETQYTFSITNADKNDQFEYTIRVKKLSNPLGT